MCERYYAISYLTHRHPGENPYEVAQRFIYAHDIPQDNLDVIAQFIIRNTPEGMAPTAGTGAPLVTGFTIPDRYIPGSAGGGGSGGDGGGAHFSTGFDLPDRYVPPSFSTPAPSSQIASSNFFPQQELVFFAAGSPDAVLRIAFLHFIRVLYNVYLIMLCSFAAFVLFDMDPYFGYVASNACLQGSLPSSTGRWMRLRVSRKQRCTA